MITIKTLEKEHIGRIIELENALLGESLGFEMLDNERFNEYAHFLVALDKDKVVGYIGGWIIKGTLELINFLVDADYQNQGIGSKLLDSLMNLEKINECILEVRETNHQAINFYLNRGFVQIHKRIEYYKNKDNALVLRKEIL